MGALSDLGSSIPGFGGTRQITPSYRANDFDGGLEIVELVDGRLAEKDKVTLLGAFMPHVPFEFGGTQQIVKDYYPGSSEPAVQVLGPRESDQTIKGKLKLKHVADRSLREAALEFQRLIDAMRIRGNLVRVTLGPWQRYGFIEETRFSLNLITDIDYEIKLSIVGFNKPIGYKFTLGDRDPQSPNKKLTNAVLDALKKADSTPISLPKTIFDTLNGYINAVANEVHKVTSFVDGIMSDLDQMQASANRAIGMIRYARSYISTTNRRLGVLVASIRSTPSLFGSEAEKTRDMVKGMRHVYEVRALNLTLAAYLAELQARFAALARTVPMVRHRVAEGDTLQRLALRYYNNADLWEAIYKHNKLRSTQLAVGSVLEIPKQ